MTQRAGIGQERRRGFNLIESAIVLGFVGLVIGGIWVSAKAVSDKWKAERIVSGLLLMVDGARNLFPPRLWPPEIAPGYTTINTTAISAGIVPTDWVRGNKIYTPGTTQEVEFKLLYPPILSTRYIFFNFSVKSRAQANFIASAVYSSNYGAGGGYCSDVPETKWWYSTDGWPPNCPDSVSGTWRLTFYFNPTASYANTN
jgi:hypothetical protein